MMEAMRWSHLFHAEFVEYPLRSFADLGVSFCLFFLFRMPVSSWNTRWNPPFSLLSNNHYISIHSPMLPLLPLSPPHTQKRQKQKKRRKKSQNRFLG